MSLFGFKDDTLLWFIILFILLFCGTCNNDVLGERDDFDNRCLR